MAVQVIVASNLGSEFDLGQVEAGKIHLKLDGTSLLRDDITGVISASGQTIDGVLAEGHNIANVKDASGTTIANIKETVIAVSQTLNGIAITKEDGTTANLTKVSTTSLVVDPTAKTLKSVVNGVESTAVDISALYADTNLIFDSYENYVLTFHTEDNTPVTINLEDLLPVVTTDTSSVDISGNGTSASPLEANVKISSTDGNSLTVDGTGLFVPAAPSQKGLQPLTSGIAIDEIGNDYAVGLVLSAEAGNTLTEGVDGLKSVLNKTNSDSIAFTGNGGATGVNGGTPLTANLKVVESPAQAIEVSENGVFVQKTYVANADASIVVEGTEGGGDYQIGVKLHTANSDNLIKLTTEGLEAVIYTDSPANSINFAGAGTEESPLTGSVRLDTTEENGNLLEFTSSGLIATVHAEGSNSIAVAGNGTEESPITVAVKLDQTVTENLIKVSANGLSVVPEDFEAQISNAILSEVPLLASVEVQDAFGTPIYRAFPI